MTDEQQSVAPHLDAIRELIPEYETDESAVGSNRRAEDPDPREWHEVHGLTADQAAELLAEHGAVDR